MNNLQSLHSHTTNSDGSMSPIELLNKGKEYGFNTIGITDHDSVLSQKQIKEISKIEDIRWISGIEISSGWPLDIGGGSSSSLHIVGLFIDSNNRKLKEYCKRSQEARVERMDRMVKNLNSIDIKITKDDCIEESGGESVGRPHIVKAIFRYEENIKRIEDIKNNLLKDSINNQNLKEKVKIIEENQIERWPYTLFLTEDSYINNIYVDYLYYLDFDNSVKLIRDSGGISILAHYYTCSYKLTPDILDMYIKDKRIDGIETIFGCYTFGTSQEDNIREHMRIAEEIANKYNCIKSEGADIHREEDFIKIKDNEEYNNKTINVLENILKDRDINIKYSNIKSH